jgi:hypothetical protein
MIAIPASYCERIPTTDHGKVNQDFLKKYEK